MNKSIISKLLMIAAAVSLAAVLAMNVSAVRNMGTSYRQIRNDDLSDGFNGTIYYDDHLYSVLGFGVQIPAEDPGINDRLDSFLSSSIRSIDERNYASGVLYTMMISLMSLLTIHENRKEKILSTILITIFIYIAFLAVFLLSCLFFKVPAYPPSTQSLINLIVSLLSVIGGNCVVSLLIDKVRHKKLVAVLIVPLLFAFFLFTTMFEAFLYSPAYVESFDSVIATIPEDRLDEAYYDEDRNVIILDGKEYKPELIRNEEHIDGIGRIGVCLLELIYPYSGNAMELVCQMIETDPPIIIRILYVLKATFWILIARHFTRT